MSITLSKRRHISKKSGMLEKCRKMWEMQNYLLIDDYIMDALAWIHIFSHTYTKEMWLYVFSCVFAFSPSSTSVRCGYVPVSARVSFLIVAVDMFRDAEPSGKMCLEM